MQAVYVKTLNYLKTINANEVELSTWTFEDAMAFVSAEPLVYA